MCSFLRCVDGLLFGQQALQLLRGADLPLWNLEELLSSGIQPTDFLVDAPRNSNPPTPAVSTRHAFESLYDLPNTHGRADGKSHINRLMESAANIGGSSQARAQTLPQELTSPGIQVSGASSSGTSSNSANTHPDSNSAGDAMHESSPQPWLLPEYIFHLPELDFNLRQTLL
ncbi:hypothetical protein [Sporisorium scitamineum]|uniref:Uncharacterized protein n=1 Tax=Sporisorium scitamineum TaxID=49012 RepID=A0A0F7RUI0_9BASI|nr:hypothetical protein [Sporisorium scitamineum]